MVTEKRLKKNHPIRMKIANVTLKKLKSFFFKLSNSHIAVLVPQIYGKWLKKCISGQIWVK